MLARIRTVTEHYSHCVLKELHREELAWLLSPRGHMPLLASHRAGMIVSRVRLWAMLFAVLTPLWIVVDLAVFAWPLWGILAAERLLASLAFAALAFYFRGDRHMRQAYLALILLFSIPTAFFVASYSLVGPLELDGASRAVALGYTFLPFVVLAGLSIFPLTLLEGVLFSLPALLGTWVAAVWVCDCADQYSLVGMFWLLGLIGVVATFSGMSQLGFMIALVRQAVRDVLTGSFTRSSGSELLDIQHILSSRNNTPLTVAFLDIDDFKAINDNFGHEAGDKVIADVACRIRANLRTGDMLVRWGGEEFLLIFPNTDMGHARLALRRVLDEGLGPRPDGAPVTASIGMAERLADAVEGWQALVEQADRRMYEAKRSGKNRVVAPGMTFIALEGCPA